MRTGLKPLAKLLVSAAVYGDFGHGERHGVGNRYRSRGARPADSGANGLPVDDSSAPFMIDLTDDQAGLLRSTISFRDDAGSGPHDG